MRAEGGGTGEEVLQGRVRVSEGAWLRKTGESAISSGKGGEAGLHECVYDENQQKVKEDITLQTLLMPAEEEAILRHRCRCPRPR